MRNQPKSLTWITALALASLSSTTVRAEDIVKEADDDTWILLSGTVVSSDDDSFRLDYGDGVVTVEMDDFDVFPEMRGMLDNDRVVVQGRVDDDLFQAKKIEASSVYVENLGTYFYGNTADDELFAWVTSAPIVVGTAEVTGTVVAVDGREFDVSTGVGTVRVDTEDMPFNPMDDKGYLRVEKGDRVKVFGTVDDDLFSKRELNAEVITELDH